MKYAIIESMPPSYRGVYDGAALADDEYVEDAGITDQWVWDSDSGAHRAPTADDEVRRLRQDKSDQITAQVPVNMPRDPELAAAAQDSADQAETALQALRDTADIDLPAFDTDLAAYLPSSFAISRKLQEQAAKVISEDATKVVSGSSTALAPQGRNDLEVWAKSVNEGGTDAPPTAVRQRVRVPLEAHGRVNIERAEVPGDASGTHGFRYTMIYDDPALAGVISLRVYNDAGSWLGYSINFSETDDPTVYTDVTPPGFYTQVAVERQHEEFAGAAAISGLFPILASQNSQSEDIRWAGEHIGSGSARTLRRRR